MAVDSPAPTAVMPIDLRRWHACFAGDKLCVGFAGRCLSSGYPIEHVPMDELTIKEPTSGIRYTEHRWHEDQYCYKCFLHVLHNVIIRLRLARQRQAIALD